MNTCYISASYHLVSEQWTSDFCEDSSRTWVLPRSFACHCYTLVVWYHMNFKENQNRSSTLLPWKSCSVDCWHIKQNSLKQPTNKNDKQHFQTKSQSHQKGRLVFFHLMAKQLVFFHLGIEIEVVAWETCGRSTAFGAKSRWVPLGRASWPQGGPPLPVL